MVIPTPVEPPPLEEPQPLIHRPDNREETEETRVQAKEVGPKDVTADIISTLLFVLLAGVIFIVLMNPLIFVPLAALYLLLKAMGAE
jgi:hypothetical protein